jgi:outer membrane protein assembly factor BamB
MAFRFNRSGSCLCLLFSLLFLHSQLLLAQQPTHRRWVFFMEQTQVQSPAVDSDGTIYIGTGRGDQTLQSDGVYAVNTDGTQKWKLTLGKSVHSSIALDQHDNLYFIVGDAHNPDSMDAALYSLDSSGNLRWKLDSIGWMAPIPNTGFTPAIAADGTIYVCGRFSLFAVNPNGTKKWKYDFPLIDNVFG